MAVQPASPVCSNNSRGADEVVHGRFELGNLASGACSIQTVIGLVADVCFRPGKTCSSPSHCCCADRPAGRRDPGKQGRAENRLGAREPGVAANAGAGRDGIRKLAGQGADENDELRQTTPEEPDG